MIARDYVLPTDSDERKQIPLFSGVLNYFPLALAAVARVSKRGNDKHNPGQPLHWARGKSMDHEDCIARHLLDVDTANPETGEYDDAMALAWRALAKLQQLEELRLRKPLSRGSWVEVPKVDEETLVWIVEDGCSCFRCEKTRAAQSGAV